MVPEHFSPIALLVQMFKSWKQVRRREGEVILFASFAQRYKSGCSTQTAVAGSAGQGQTQTGARQPPPPLNGAHQASAPSLPNLTALGGGSINILQLQYILQLNADSNPFPGPQRHFLDTVLYTPGQKSVENLTREKKNI